MTIQTFTAGQRLTALQLNTLQASGFNFTRNVRNDLTYTFALSDKGKLVESANAGSAVFTIANDSSIEFAVGDRVDVLLASVGSVTISPASGVTLYSEGSITTIASTWTRVTLIKRADNSWVMTGSGMSVQTVELDDLAVTTDKIANLNVTTGKIDDLAVTTGKIATNAVDSAKLASHASTDASRAVTTNHIRDAAVTTAKLGTNLSLTGTTKIEEIFEKAIINTTVHPSPTGSPLTLDIADGAVYYYTTPCPHTFTLDITATGMVTEQALTLVFMMTSSATTGRVNVIKVNNTTPAYVKWFGGNQYPLGSGGNAVDVYTITILNIAGAFTVFASQSKFA